MLKNYLKILFRNFKSNKFYTFINIIGLSIGLTCVILISLFVTDETSFDTFHKDNDQIYFVGVERTSAQRTYESIITPYPTGRVALENVQAVEMYVTITPANSGRLSLDGENFTDEDKIIAASDDFFSMFNFPLISGNPETVLNKPNTVVITEKIAQKYFGDENPIGKPLTIYRYGIHDYTIVGVAENSPDNSYLDFDVVFSIKGLPSTISNMDSWGANMYNTFVKLQKGVQWNQIEKSANTTFDTFLGENRAESTDFFLQPISELYLSEFVTPSGFKGNYTYIYIFSSIAFIILILAGINYMNLSTARGMQRGREVGVRKVLGANKIQLVKQFLGESVLLSMFSLILALFLTELILPKFNLFFDKSLSINLIENFQFLIGLLLGTLVLGILSGLYPSLLLSGFQSSDILKGQSSKKIGGVNPRKALVVFQFSISTVLIVGTIVVLSQLDYLINKDLGFKEEHALYIPLYSSDNKDAFLEEIKKSSNVISASFANGVPGRFYFSTGQKFNPRKPDEEFFAHVIATDENYPEALGIELIAGRYFEKERSNYLINTIVINESMQKKMDWVSAEDALGESLASGETVIGVVKDFNFQSLRSEVSPVIINSINTPNSSFSGGELVLVRYQADALDNLIPHIRTSWDKVVSGSSIEINYLDQQMDTLYETDKKLGTVFSFFAGIGILISCMGLLGLTAFSAELRTKEIGIRKVLGATVSNIISLLSIDFIRLVLIGFALAIPISWYIMSKWLNDFAYKIDIGVGVFAIAASLVLVITIIITSWQSIKASLMNPVNSLKSE